MASDFLRRALGRRGGPRRFAAIASPHGIHVAEYRRDRHGLEILASVRGASPGADPAALGSALADAVESIGGPGGHLALAISGYGSAHHILTLPTADPELLRPVVRRELLRYYPNLDEPVVDFTAGAPMEGSGRQGGKAREMLVGAVPRPVGEKLHATLRERGVRLQHLTVLPQAVQRVFDAFDGSADPVVALLLLESGPLIGCFHGGALRLFIEPPTDVHGRPLREPGAVAEQVERANLFLRQQFPGVAVDQVLVAAPAKELDAIKATLSDRLESKIRTLSDAPPGSLAALGAALDYEATDPLTLLPGPLRPPTRSQSWTRHLAAAAAAVMVFAAAWWAGAGILVARAEADRALEADRAVRDEVPWLSGAMTTLDARSAHEQRVAFLRQTVASRDNVRAALAAVSEAAGPAVRLDHMSMQRTDEGWRLQLRGIATGTSAADAYRAWDTMYRGVAERLPVIRAEPGEAQGIDDPEGAPVAVAFDMSFIVLWDSDLER